MGKKEIVAIMVDDGVISLQQLKEAEAEQKLVGMPIEKVLVSKGYVSSEDLAQALSKQLNVPYVKLSDEDLNTQVVHLIPREVARKFNAIPVTVKGNMLHIAFMSPLNLPAIEEIKLLTGFNIKPLVASAREIEEAINRHFSIEEVSKQTLIDMRLKKLKEDKDEEEETALVEEEVGKIDDIPVVRLANDILEGAMNAGASDIHLEPQFPEMIVRYRIDGILHDVMTVPKHVERPFISRIKILANMDITEHRRPQDGHINIKKNEKEYDIRVSTLLTVIGEKVVMRILDRSSMLVTLDALGLAERDEMNFRSLITKPYGMILVTGPTGSGKTTTLYAVLGQLDSKTLNIITIEDPVEYRLDRITQVQVDAASKISFATGLRTMLRQDPDIIMVGEIRDKETAEISIQAALTGHLVLSTLHTNDAPSVVTRMIDMGIEPFLIASTVIGAVAQRLCRKICPECKIEYAPSQKELDFLKEAKVATEGMMLARGQGCAFCYNSGFRGRSAIYEVMRVTDAVRKPIIERRSRVDIMEMAIKEGMTTLQQNGIRKIVDKISTIEEIKRVVYVE